jgi:hypothetical protein
MALTVFGGCFTSYHTRDALIAGRQSQSAVWASRAAGKKNQKRDIPVSDIRSIYAESVEALDLNTWASILQNDDAAKAEFRASFKSMVQRYIDEGVLRVTHRKTDRTKGMNLLTSSKVLPNLSAIGLAPARSYFDSPSFKPHAKISRGSQDAIDKINVTLPCSIRTLSAIGTPRDALSRNVNDLRTVSVTFTRTEDWLKKDILAKSAVLKPILQTELSRLEGLPKGAIRGWIEADVEHNIAGSFNALLDRQIRIGTSVTRDLEIQESDHPSLSVESDGRIGSAADGPKVVLTMQPIMGQERPVPPTIMYEVLGDICR